MICSGCGVRIQTDDPTKPGYVPERALTRETIICQRCFRIRHYNEVAEVALNPDDYRRLLSSIGEQPAVVVMVVDLFDLEGSWIAGMQRHIGGQTLHLVANKCDLFPPETNWQRMEQWLYRQAREQGLAPTGISFVSAEKNIGIDELLERIGHLRRSSSEHVFLVGMTNVGKSTLMNRLMERLAKPVPRVPVATGVVRRCGTRHRVAADLAAPCRLPKRPRRGPGGVGGARARPGRDRSSRAGRARPQPGRRRRPGLRGDRRQGPSRDAGRTRLDDPATTASRSLKLGTSCPVSEMRALRPWSRCGHG